MTEPSASAGARPTVPAVPVVNAANALTGLRMVLVPVFVLFVVVSGMTHPGWRVAACLTFLVASATDLVDGWIARRYGLVTSFGKVADPIADKALTGTALVLLSWYDLLPWWVTALVLIRELGITLIRFWVLRHGVIAASRGGKAKTALQITAIAWYLLPLPGLLAAVGPWIMGAALLITVATGLDYVVRAVRLRRPTPLGGGG
ncbi:MULTISPECIES: CDP-diacylglycerol--glycerol-3-phosphate 3-phosphatidyltransferase [unclassified Solwaraspora]|uniref:CDP-diacylglycerol--glycerol-3-phosphate 3-phosphatidyltransferase n=1 Tax=unclassified Solwaraspora TaxID=2627926 RepID=UPI00259B982C|nr:CDP-diacylglycerol--glycerol-3-phosphate 3-phosphatidyltransferase [Solwaraspora sp. WMMA2056]WJK39898.1 CDP-diacylglycerol--glycerol-3-phosphate 3-phosphatidyltransferase [Solwaraspora sp. WMMA2056]